MGLTTSAVPPSESEATASDAFQIEVEEEYVVVREESFSRKRAM